MQLNKNQQIIAEKIKALKDAAGSHSPSIFTLIERIPELKITIDACFLSNPYATDLFMRYLQQELCDTKKLRDVLEFYPSQNSVIAEVLANRLDLDKECIFVGNGAIEVIQAVLHNFVERKIVVNIPTFSSYYEFSNTKTEVVLYQLAKEKDFALDTQAYIEFVKTQKPQSIVIINPNNPDGGYIPYEELRLIIASLPEVENIIIDESFLHFAFEDDTYSFLSYSALFKEFPNVILIKSMSKDFGIAGIRAGYGIMAKDKVARLLQNGYLWNSNGLSEYFFRLYVRNGFISEYENVRKLYIQQTQEFFTHLSQIPKLKVYPSKANFAIIEILNGETSTEFVMKMLIKYGIYVRTCSDKIGLNGEFIRLASRSKEENTKIIQSLHNELRHS
ncbi:pyridoxal phosphate-dependent aminotransferase [uncultured Helicobacter sp.]|uniref:pyridoxal phosphate-dependent aminotransferase n=1 Tax=uncultured Helicobacter sp. TaxID=175537 RepID=UPI0037522738